MVARRYRISLRVFKLISQVVSFKQLTNLINYSF